ncbi:hypothetical protein Hjap01_04288 [Haloarcula japonica]|jgi:hypothetical protein
MGGAIDASRPQYIFTLPRLELVQILVDEPANSAFSPISAMRDQ